MGKEREVWFRGRRWCGLPVNVYPVHWKGFAAYLLASPGFAIVLFADQLEAVLAGFFPVVLLLLIVGGAGLAAFGLLMLDHLELQ